MSRFNGMGPNNEGPQTGRGLGNCMNSNGENSGGFNCRRPKRRFRRNQNDFISNDCFDNVVVEEEIDYLKKKLEFLENKILDTKTSN